MNQTRGKCIFCDRGASLTKEHLFSDWLGEFFPRSDADTHTFGEIEFQPEPRELMTARQGHSGSKKVRKVCHLCNNEWISVIDAAAKAAMVPLLRSERRALSEKAQRDIAVWSSKIAMVGDCNRPQRSKISQAERDQMRTDALPPRDWQVWLGTYGGTYYRDLFIYQHGGRLSSPPVPSPIPFNGYLQTTVMGIGSVFLVVLSTDISVLGFELGVVRRLMRQIYPFHGDLPWPFETVISEEEAPYVVNILATLLAKPIHPDPRL